MAIQFPPVNQGDPQPQDGDTYLYFITQSEFVCHRRSQSEAAQWSEKGVINTTSFGYRGNVEITKPAPIDANKGNIYSVIDGGIADASFEGLAGTIVEQWSLIIFEDPKWNLINVESGNVTTSPWIRTVDGQIKPSIATDDLNMDQGDYLINTLPEL
jgi:hypothetical protein